VSTGDRDLGIDSTRDQFYVVLVSVLLSKPAVFSGCLFACFVIFNKKIVKESIAILTCFRLSQISSNADNLSRVFDVNVMKSMIMMMKVNLFMLA